MFVLLLVLLSQRDNSSFLHALLSNVYKSTTWILIFIWFFFRVKQVKTSAVMHIMFKCLLIWNLMPNIFITTYFNLFQRPYIANNKNNNWTFSGRLALNRDIPPGHQPSVLICLFVWKSWGSTIPLLLLAWGFPGLCQSFDLLKRLRRGKQWKFSESTGGATQYKDLGLCLPYTGWHHYCEAPVKPVKRWDITSSLSAPFKCN